MKEEWEKMVRAGGYDIVLPWLLWVILANMAMMVPLEWFGIRILIWKEQPRAITILWICLCWVGRLLLWGIWIYCLVTG